jgi:hypothetical protein
MDADHYFDHSAQRRNWLGRMVQGLIASTVAIVCLALTAKADVIIDYTLNMSAQVSSYSYAVYGDYIYVTGTFAYDATLGHVTTANLSVTGNLQASNLPAAGVSLTSVQTGSEDQNDIDVFSSTGDYQLAFEFANSLNVGGTDLVLNNASTDNGPAYFYDAHDGYAQYHIGYYGVTGGAVPEPGSLMLLAVPLLGLAFLSRRAVGKRLSA